VVVNVLKEFMYATLNIHLLGILDIALKLVVVVVLVQTFLMEAIGSRCSIKEILWT
jgi:hypothetical protein